MSENLISDEKFNQSYLNLKNFAILVQKDYDRVIGDNFGESEWKKEGQTIDTNMKSFEKSANEMNDIIAKIEKDLVDIKGQVEPKIKAMKEKIKGFNVNLENNKIENTEEEDKKKLMQIMKEKELLEQIKNSVDVAFKNMESLTQTKKEWQNSNYLEQNKKLMESLSELSKQYDDELTKIQGHAKTGEQVENVKKNADKKDE
jgi:hypothetical protein